MGWRVTEVIERLTNKHETLSSKPSNMKEKKKKHSKSDYNKEY
jgi:hypothetical protein